MSDKRKQQDSEFIKAYVRIRPVGPSDEPGGLKPVAVLEKLEENKIMNRETGECFEYGRSP
jgi:hypothetical protein